jgi:hypothetical protein
VILDDRGMPWTIRLSLGWTIILALFSGGILFVPLGLYLAYWVRTRQGRSVAFWCYLILTVISILGLLLPQNVFDRYASPAATGALVSIWVTVLVLWFVAPLVLRSELRSLYRRCWEISLPINILLTILFSSLYLNYSVPDLPVASSSESLRNSRDHPSP